MVVAIIGILAAITIPNFLTAIDKSKQVSSVAGIKGIGLAIEIYRIDNGLYPNVATVFDLFPMLDKYASSLSPLDGWNNAIGYSQSAQSYSVECFGKDGVDAGNISPGTRNVFVLDIIYSGGEFTAGVD